MNENKEPKPPFLFTKLGSRYITPAVCGAPHHTGHTSTRERPLLFIFYRTSLSEKAARYSCEWMHHHLFNIPLNASSLSLLQAKLWWILWPNLLVHLWRFFSCRINSNMQNCWVRADAPLTFSLILRVHPRESRGCIFQFLKKVRWVCICGFLLKLNP